MQGNYKEINFEGDVPVPHHGHVHIKSVDEV
jgi:hypothetical protein